MTDRMMDKNKNEDFQVLQLEHGGKPLFATINLKLRDFTKKEQYPWFLSLSISLKEPTEEGLTTNAEAEELNRFEDFLERQIKKTTKCVHIGRVTWGGYREVLFYVSEPEIVSSWIQTIIDSGEYRTFSFKIVHDIDWESVSIYFNK